MRKFDEPQENSEGHFNDLRNKTNEEEYLTKDIEIVKNTKILKLKNSINEMNKLESTGNRADQVEEKILGLLDRNLEMIQMEEERELRFFLEVKKH